jgi:hypothetical protein
MSQTTFTPDRPVAIRANRLVPPIQTQPAANAASNNRVPRPASPTSIISVSSVGSCHSPLPLDLSGSQSPSTLSNGFASHCTAPSAKIDNFSLDDVTPGGDEVPAVDGEADDASKCILSSPRLCTAHIHSPLMPLSRRDSAGSAYDTPRLLASLEDQAGQEIRTIFTSAHFESPCNIECLSPPTRTQNPVVQDAYFCVPARVPEPLPILELDEPHPSNFFPAAYARSAVVHDRGTSCRIVDEFAHLPRLSTSC